jgi:hypothetical protein
MMATPPVKVTLDLTIFDIPQLIERLRDSDHMGVLDVAKQIEAQTKPPKPAEPTGLGAVVEDAAGQQWVRITNPNQTPWMRGGSFPRQWRHIDAVKVLSEGVQP